MVVSHPPYEARPDAASLPPGLSDEPEMALFAGGDGRDVIRRLVAQATDLFVPGAWLLFELSPEQAKAAQQALLEAGFVELERHFDLAKKPRALGARRPVE